MNFFFVIFVDVVGTVESEEQKREMKSEMEEYRRIIDEEMTSVSNVVNSSFYRTQSEFLRVSPISSSSQSAHHCSKCVVCVVL